MKNTINSLLFLILIMVLSCETVIPEVDTTLPTFSFEISGNGFSRTFTQEDDFSRMQLNLKANSVYRFIFSGNDSGGVELAQWQLGGSDEIDFIRPDFDDVSWDIRTISAISRMIEWRGDRSEPKTAAILTGNFRTGNISGTNGVIGSSRFFVKDFGGRSGVSNEARGTLSVLIGDHSTELIAF